MRKLRRYSWLLLLLIFVFTLSACGTANGTTPAPETANTNDHQTSTRTEDPQVTYTLPAPRLDGEMSVEQALASRRSRRNFRDEALTPQQLSQLLWAAYGITLPVPENPALRGGLRTTPSAGATFPLEIYAVVGLVEGIAPGVYRYLPAEHKLVRVVEGDIRDALAEAAVGQRMVAAAPVSIFYSAVMERTTGVYGERGVMYVHMEIGHSAQNVYLQAEAMGLGTCAIGAFSDDSVRQLLHLPEEEVPLYLMPVGYFYE